MTALIGIWKFLTSPLGKYILAAGLALALLGAILLWHQRAVSAHDEALKTSWEADQRALVASERAAAYAAGQQVVAAKHAAEIAAIQASAPVIQEIIRRAAPDPTAVSAPDRAALDELRRRQAGPGDSP
jgi:hypothetical protein